MQHLAKENFFIWSCISILLMALLKIFAVLYFADIF